MQNQFYITANICGFNYYLKISETDSGDTEISYQGLLCNATEFPTRQEAVKKARSLPSKCMLLIYPLDPAQPMAGARLPLYDRLRELRKNPRLTQEVAADRLGVSREAYQSYESGRGAPSLTTLANIAKLYRISIEELIKGKSGIIAHY